MKDAVSDTVCHKFMLPEDRGVFVIPYVCVRVVPYIDAPEAAWRFSWHEGNLEISAQDERIVCPISTDERIHCLMNHERIHLCITHPGLVKFECSRNFRRLTIYLFILPLCLR